MSPYAIIPNKFATDMLFRNTQEEAGDSASQEASELENCHYQSLVAGCREFARTCPRRVVDFEFKISYVKEGAGMTG